MNHNKRNLPYHRGYRTQTRSIVGQHVDPETHAEGVWFGATPTSRLRAACLPARQRTHFGMQARWRLPGARVNRFACPEPNVVQGALDRTTQSLEVVRGTLVTVLPYITIGIAAFLTSGLTLFSGFGLGTLLLPAFSLFFDIEVAVALTAIVHLFNNLFKLLLLGKNADRSIVLTFGIPAILAAIVGAWTLLWLSNLSSLWEYELLSRTFAVMPIKLTLAILMVGFAAIEVVPTLQRISFRATYIPLGGVLSGFFGGLSGHQGALRSAFLLRCGLSKERFIATGVVIACLVDVPRIAIYSSHLASAELSHNAPLLLTAIATATLGALLASRLITKVTMGAVRGVVATLLVLIAIGLGSGIV